MKIRLSEYQEEWKTLFKIEKIKIEKAIIDNFISIEHIGSTSIQNLAAKPIIDIMIGIQDFTKAENFVISLQDIGYKYIPEYETTFPERKFLIRFKNDIPTHHIHMVEYDSHFWRRHIFFREYLKQNPTTKENYESLKRNLELKEWKDGNEYASAKSEFIRGIESKAECLGIEEKE